MVVYITYNLIKTKNFHLSLCSSSDCNTFSEGGVVKSHPDTITPFVTLQLHTFTSIGKEIFIEFNKCKELKYTIYYDW
jgi:hypothetical protein